LCTVIPSSTMATETIDQILIGDKMYLNAPEVNCY
jgi:hypothetical protein